MTLFQAHCLAEIQDQTFSGAVPYFMLYHKMPLNIQIYEKINKFVEQNRSNSLEIICIRWQLYQPDKSLSSG